MHTTHIGGSQSQGGSHPSHEENTRSMQLEIAHLRKSLRRRTTPSSYGPSFDDDSDISYRPRSRTPPSKFFSCDKDHHHRWRRESLPCQGLGNDAISRALN